MKKLKQFLSSLLTVALLLTIAPSAFAAVNDTGFSDVAADAWYADAAMYVRDNEVMYGTSATTFGPNTTMSRAMLATVLYRAAGSPDVSGGSAFTDVAADAYYADAAAWASANGIVSGYGNGLFGSNDPVTREQIATILWRYDGSETVGTTASFTDASSISDYARSAVNWAVANGIVSGMTDGSFAPTASATRAQVAVMLYHYLTSNSNIPDQPTESGNTLVVYFSGSGNTEAVAETIAETLDADIFEITPADPYTDADLDWTDSDSRVNEEHENEDLRDIELVSDSVDNWEDYDTVFIGYPIWWGIAAWPVNGFVEANDFTGKTVIPFSTSTSSGMGESAELLEELAGTGDWQEGRRFSERPAQSDIQNWVNSLELNTTDDSSANEEARSLVVYFSMPETTDPNNMTEEEANSTMVIDGEVLGNTQYMAYVIQEQTGADIFRIEPVTPYPTDHDTLVDLAAEEQDENARPAIRGRINDLENYDVVYLGYPNWWGDMPMILYTFLDSYDFSGKTIVPFNTHGGSGFSSTIRTIRSLEPDATVLDGLSISRNSIQDAEQEILDWINGLD